MRTMRSRRRRSSFSRVNGPLGLLGSLVLAQMAAVSWGIPGFFADEALAGRVLTVLIVSAVALPRVIGGLEGAFRSWRDAQSGEPDDIDAGGDIQDVSIEDWSLHAGHSTLDPFDRWFPPGVAAIRRAEEIAVFTAARGLAEDREAVAHLDAMILVYRQGPPATAECIDCWWNDQIKKWHTDVPDSAKAALERAAYDLRAD